MKNKIPIIHPQIAVSSKISCFDQHLARGGHNGQQENKNGIPHYSVTLRHFHVGYISVLGNRFKRDCSTVYK